MTLSATVTDRVLKIQSFDGSNSRVYPLAGVYAAYENFAEGPVCRLVLQIENSRTVLIEVADDPESPSYGNSIFGSTTASGAMAAAENALGSPVGGSSDDAAAATTQGVDQSNLIQSIATDVTGIPGGLEAIQDIKAATDSIDESVRDGIEGSPLVAQILGTTVDILAAIPEAVADFPGVPIPGESIASGDVGGSAGPSGPPGSGLFGWLSTIAAYLRRLPPPTAEGNVPVDVGGDIDAKLTDIDDRLLLTETRSYRRYTEKAFSSASANNAAAVVSLPAQGPTGVIVIDEIIACYASAPVQGQLSVTGIQTLGSAPVMNAAHQMPIVAAGPAPLTVRMRGAANQPVSISLAAGGSGVVAVLWVGWHVE
jgi:hypothetical protein